MSDGGLRGRLTQTELDNPISLVNPAKPSGQGTAQRDRQTFLSLECGNRRNFSIDIKRRGVERFVTLIALKVSQAETTHLADSRQPL